MPSTRHPHFQAFPSDYSSFWLEELGDRIVSCHGENWSVRSPFRDDRHPSVSVNIRSGLYNDFSEGGMTPLAYLMRRYGISLAQADAHLRDRFHLDWTQAPPAPKPKSFRDQSQLIPEKFRFVEVLQGGFYRGTGGRVVEHPAGLTEDFAGLEGKTDCAMSIFLHPETLYNYWKDPEQGGGTGLIAGYEGPVRLSALPFDFDHRESLKVSLEETLQFVTRLRDRFHIAPGDIRVYFSGRKGFHVLVLDDGFQSLAPAYDVPEKAKNAARLMGDGLECLDLSIYKRTALLRVPNTRHSKSGLFKVPLFLEDLQTLSIEEIRSLAGNPRHLHMERPKASLEDKESPSTASPKRFFSKVHDQVFEVDPKTYTARFADGVEYRLSEMTRLRGLDEEDLRAVHLCKKHFGATVKGVSDGI